MNDRNAGGVLPERPEDWDGFYIGGTPPWDIGEPQPAFARLADQGEVRGRVLDAGCGTGEHALMAAASGLEAVGVDAAPTAIERARAKAAQRGLSATFVVGDVLDLAELVKGVFDTVIDCGLFHLLTDEHRVRYEASLAAVTAPAGRAYVLCFSERMGGTDGPRRVTQAALRNTFADGWTVAVAPSEIATVGLGGVVVPAWLATITRER